MDKIKIKSTRDIWAKGKGLPKNGLHIVRNGQLVELIKKNSQWFIMANHRGKQLFVATIPETIGKELEG